MGGEYCSVSHCNNKSLKVAVADVSFHRFPQNPSIFRKWRLYCNRSPDWIPRDGDRICSRHFKDEDFSFNCSTFSESGTRSRRRLHKNAIPSVGVKYVQINKETPPQATAMDIDVTNNVDASSATPFVPQPVVVGKFSDAQKMLTGNQQRVVIQADTICLIETPNEEHRNDVNVKSLLSELDALKKNFKTEQERSTNLFNANINLSKQLGQERQKNIGLEKQLQKTMNSKGLVLAQHELQLKIKDLLKGTLSSQQLDKILNINKKVKWAKEDITKAFTLRYLSKRAYLFMQQQNYPLPNLRTLQRYASINLKRGLIEDVLTFMKISSEKLSSRDKTTVLSYGKMKVSCVHEYEKSNHHLLGPYKFVQIIMAKGLCANWKQPVYMEFDREITKEILCEVITALDKISFNVVAIVDDWDGTMLTPLAISKTSFTFAHPCTQLPIFYFPDAVHLLKLLRVWLLETGFLLPRGELVGKIPLENLLVTNDLSKWTKDYLRVKSDSEQLSLHFATQLFSLTTAKVLRRYETEESTALANLIEIVVAWYDIMNSNLGTQSTAYTQSNEQLRKLEEMYKMIRSMRCIGKPNLLSFQRLILISIKSLQLFYQTMKTNYNIGFILTSKLNRLSLERLFDEIRSWEGVNAYDPSPMHVMYRLKIVMLGRSPGLVRMSLNRLQNDTTEEYLSSSVLQQTSVTSQEESFDEIDDLELPLTPCTANQGVLDDEDELMDTTRLSEQSDKTNEPPCNKEQPRCNGVLPESSEETPANNPSITKSATRGTEEDEVMQISNWLAECDNTKTSNGIQLPETQDPPPMSTKQNSSTTDKLENGLAPSTEPQQGSAKITAQEKIRSPTPSTNNHLILAHQSEENRLIHLSGWLAGKFKMQYPDLGTSANGGWDHDFVECTNNERCGGLAEPSLKLIKNIRIIEHLFSKLNKHGFPNKKNVAKILLFHCQDKVDLPDEVIEEYVKRRLDLEN
uniref:THAP-type domain-containing protein n=2 Tax=Photinus pyralis TaxID=7054 RepID=A0A1Y1K8E2_PHOPY